MLNYDPQRAKTLALTFHCTLLSLERDKDSDLLFIRNSNFLKLYIQEGDMNISPE